VGFSLAFRRVVIGIADAHRDDGKRFIVRADEKLTAFLGVAAAVQSDSQTLLGVLREG
jgi:hypothetical protein